MIPTCFFFQRFCLSFLTFSILFTSCSLFITRKAGSHGTVGKWFLKTKIGKKKLVISPLFASDEFLFEFLHLVEWQRLGSYHISAELYFTFDAEIPFFYFYFCFPSWTGG